MIDCYILDDQRRPKRVDPMEWAQWVSAGKGQVGKDVVDRYCVSTVFLGIDHSFGGVGPVLWETMVFGHGSFDGKTDRCGGTWEQAEEMHRRMVLSVKDRHIKKTK